MRSNCILFAVRLYWRRRKAGAVGYLMLRRSWSGPFPHLLYVELQGRKQPRIVGYSPRHPRDRHVPPPFFEGYVRWGDKRPEKKP